MIFYFKLKGKECPALGVNMEAFLCISEK